MNEVADSCEQELEERLRSGLRPTTLFCVLYVAVSYGAMLGSLPAEHPLTHSLLLSGPRALFSFLGSHPAKQLSLHERWLCLGLLASMLISTTFANYHFS